MRSPGTRRAPTTPTRAQTQTPSCRLSCSDMSVGRSPTPPFAGKGGWGFTLHGAGG
jgi:hypothetical protein